MRIRNKRARKFTPQESQPIPTRTFEWGSANHDECSPLAPEEEMKPDFPAPMEPENTYQRN